MNPSQFLEWVIRPTLKRLDYGRNDSSVENLLLGTAIVESQGLSYLHQIGGPALSLYQIEPATHDDIWDNFIAYREDLASKVRSFASQRWFTEDDEAMDSELMTNLAYSTVIARVHYMRVPEPIPDDLEGQAAYWKTYYNITGKGTPEHYLALFNKYYGPDLQRSA